MKADNVLTDEEVFAADSIKNIFNTIKEKNNKLKLKITLDETISNKLQYYVCLDEINRYIDSQL